MCVCVCVCACTLLSATSLLSQCVRHKCVALLAHVSEEQCVRETQHEHTHLWSMTGKYEPQWLRMVFDRSLSHTHMHKHASYLSHICWHTIQMCFPWMFAGKCSGWRCSPSSGPKWVPAGMMSVVKTPSTFWWYRIRKQTNKLTLYVKIALWTLWNMKQFCAWAYKF